MASYCQSMQNAMDKRGYLANPTRYRQVVNPPLPKVQGLFGYDGAGMTVLEHIEQKTHHDRYATDYICRQPLKKFGVPGCDINSTAYPLSMACQPIAEPPQIGLNQAEIVQGENSIRLYSTYTNCVGELDARFMAAQF